MTCEKCGREFLVKKQRVGTARWCSRWCRYGTERERFESHVTKTDTCWLWTGNMLPTGYAVFSRNTPAHRKAYELYVGAIPSGMQIDHLCRVRNCVNPAHLEPVTPRENVLRGESPMALHARKAHCPQGHPYDEANTYWRPDGKGRDCFTCRRARAKAVAQ